VDPDNPVPPGYEPSTAASTSQGWAVPESAADDPIGVTLAKPVPGGEAARAWSAPEIRTEPGSVSKSDPEEGWDHRSLPVRPPRLPVPLKAMTVPDVLDGAWAIIKVRPRTIFAISAMIVIPVELVVAGAQRILTEGSDFSSLFPGFGALGQVPSSSGPNPPSGGSVVALFAVVYLGAALRALSYFFLGGAIAKVVSAWYGGGDITARQAVMASLRKGWVFTAAFFVLLIPKVFGLCAGYIGAAFVIPLLMLTAPVIMIENLGPIAGARRSMKLVSRRLFPCMLVWFLSYVLESVVNTALAALPQLLAVVTPRVVGDLLVPSGSAFARVITGPVVVGVCVLLYYDLRVRSEGLDLDVDAADAFARAQ
jgi:hypothetical protein